MSNEHEHGGGVPPLPKGLRVMQVPVISSRHLTRYTLAWLRAGRDIPLWTIPYPFGVLVHVQPEETWAAMAHNTNEGEDLKAGLAPCMRWAKTHGFRWIRFDPDGEVLDGVPTYE